MNQLELKHILEQHQIWFNSGGKKGQGANLEGANLKGADLAGASLDGANLKGADLSGANLKGAYLQCADLRGVNLKGADLLGAYLYGSKLQGSIFTTELRSVDNFCSCMITKSQILWLALHPRIVEIYPTLFIFED